VSGGWRKRGLLWEPPGPLPWANSHAALPALERIEGDRFRLYFSPRDRQGRAHVARVEATLEEGSVTIGEFDREPVIAPGPLGGFDDRGTAMACIAGDGDRRLLFYSGWSLGVTVPFYFFTGLAVSEDGGERFRRSSDAPLLDRAPTDPFLNGSPFVLRDGAAWRMWFVTGSGWEDGKPPSHRYRIGYAESTDGISWRRDGTIAIDYRDETEHSISRPCVVHGGDRYRMWFAARGSSYRLGYAESTDGIEWERDDARAGLAPGEDGWDEEMVAYPFVCSHGGFDYLFYNGNGYGRTGVGYAVREHGGAEGNL
jgi:hypothetical protein